ncbi:hypothetical protein [Aquipuribacter hungaricus]|uniref:DUF3592 domain-containing protein n=1 Tax=Aquipuribacter hungaricus TaxID=545624 RepID=A0ABV7WKW1_9MICO
MRLKVSAGLVLLQVLVLMPLFLGGIVLVLEGVYMRRAAQVFAGSARCVVNVEYVSSLSRTDDPLRVVTDGGGCGRSDQYLVSYVGVPEDQRITEGELEVELGTTSGGVEVARPATVATGSPQIVAAMLWVGAALAAIGAVLEVAWFRHVRRLGL